jgi:hypothetical protein
MVDAVGESLIAAWTPPGGAARVYVVPAGCNWKQVVGWLVEQAIPELVPAAASRARVGHVAANLLTASELSARQSLDAAREEAARRDAELLEAVREAELGSAPIREGLLHGRGDALKHAVLQVAIDAGAEVEDLDETFGSGRSSDLLIHFEGRFWLLECRTANGGVSEDAVLDVKKHLETWKALGRDEPLERGVMVVSQFLREQDPLLRPARPYTREEFIQSLDVTVIDAVALYLRWADGDLGWFTRAVTGPPQQHAG